MIQDDPFSVHFDTCSVETLEAPIINWALQEEKKGGNEFPFQWHAIFKSDLHQLSSAMMTPAK